MNPLEALKEKLKIKPSVEQRKPVEIIIQQQNVEELKEKIPSNLNENLNPKTNPNLKKQVKFKEDMNPSSILTLKPKIQKLTIFDRRNEGFDRETLMKKLAETKLLKVTVKPTILNKISEEEKQTTIVKAPIVAEIKKAKKIRSKPKLIIEEEEEEEEEKENEGKLHEEQPKEEAIILIPPPTKKERKTKKIEKGIAVLGPESVVIIGDTPIVKRIPQAQPKINIHVSKLFKKFSFNLS